jgi:hypothetical protein
MSFEDLVTAAQQYFPKLQIRYKDQSWFMKLIGTLLFFNKSFMTSYTTTIGSTVYFPNEAFTKTRPVSAAVVLLHELVHVKDAQKISKPLFFFLYLFPQVLAPLSLLLLLVSWKIAIPLFILFSLPIPAYFRMYFEKRAYLTSLYALATLGKKMKFNPLLATQEQGFCTHFKDASYYFMWPFSDVKKDLDDGVERVKAGQRPFEDPVFDILDDLISKV